MVTGQGNRGVLPAANGHNNNGGNKGTHYETGGTQTARSGALQVSSHQALKYQGNQKYFNHASEDGSRKSINLSRHQEAHQILEN